MHMISPIHVVRVLQAPPSTAVLTMPPWSGPFLAPARSSSTTQLLVSAPQSVPIPARMYFKGDPSPGCAQTGHTLCPMRHGWPGSQLQCSVGTVGRRCGLLSSTKSETTKALRHLLRRTNPSQRC
jgi:hypothetical protein